MSRQTLVPLEEPVERFQSSPCLLQPLFTEDDRTAVVRTEEEEPDRLATVTGDQVGKPAGSLGTTFLSGSRSGDMFIRERLGGTRFPFGSAAHFSCGFAFEQPIVEPILGHRLAMAAFALSDFVLVMREHEIEATAMNIERLAKQRFTHRGTLDVPARPSRSPGTVPTRLSFLGSLPESEVGGVAFPIGRLATFALKRLPRTVGQLAVFLVFGDIEKDIAVHLIGITAVNQLLDERNDGRNVLSRLGHVVDLIDAECPEVGKVVFGHLSSQFGHGDASSDRALDELVIDVGDVHDPRDVVSVVDEVTFDRIENDGADHVADVSLVVDGWAAEINADAAVVDWDEGLLAPGERVVDLDGGKHSCLCRFRGLSQRAGHRGISFTTGCR